MRKYEQYTTETLVKKVLIHGHLTGYRRMGLDLESDEYYQELLAEIKARIAEGGDKQELYDCNTCTYCNASIDAYPCSNCSIYDNKYEPIEKERRK